MNPVESLVRLRKWLLDERRQALAELYRQEDELRMRLAVLEAEVQSEAAAATAEALLAGGGFAAYAERMAGRRRAIEAEADALQPRIAEARDLLNDAFSECKASELVAREIAEREAAEVKRLEQARLDEVGLQIYRRAGGA